MADFAENPTNKKKRKLKPSQSKPPKTHRRVDETEQHSQFKTPQNDDFNSSFNLEEEDASNNAPWGNLQLILSIKNKDLGLQTKVKLAYHFVNTRRNNVGGDIDEGSEAVSISRVIVFLNDWVQSLLISSENKNKGEGGVPEVIGSCLDFRCWQVFRFCLEESLKRKISLTFSRNLLRAISNVSRSALSLLNDTSLHSKELCFVGEGFELYNVVLDCLSLVFSSHGGVFNENLDLWISTVVAVLELVPKVYNAELESSNAGIFVLRLSSLLLEPFSKFLRVHPCRKNGFRDFIDKLLEPLLYILGSAKVQIDGDKNEWSRNLFNFTEEVLSQGLFHPIHIDGFLSLNGTEKYVTALDGEPNNSKWIIKSYHRHLFDRLEKNIAANNVSVLNGLGDLFHLLVRRVKMQKGASLHSEGTPIIDKTGDSGKSYNSSSSSTNIQKSLFDFFVQIMEPLLVKVNNYSQTTLEEGPVLLLDAHNTLKSVNNILGRFMDEKIYVRTGDTSDGGCFNFLKKAYDIIGSFPIKNVELLLSTKDVDQTTSKKVFSLIARELIVSAGHFVEIEYEVIGEDLVSLWLMLFSFVLPGRYIEETPDKGLLDSAFLHLGCQLINLYSDLRQVNSIVIALCKALRIHKNDGEAYSNSLSDFIGSREFRLVLYKAVKSLPEGQASGCIQELAMDLTETLEWMKGTTSDLRSHNMTLLGSQLAILGTCLSEIYTRVLDSLTVTTGNSILVGNSLNGLMTVIRPCMSSLVGIAPISINEFLFSIIGNFQEEGSTHWVILFFFRLYLSCRSLHQQAITLSPPDSAKKMSSEMGDLITACSGRDRMEDSNWKDKGYFSWIVKPSASLLIVIESIDVYVKHNASDFSPLIYVLHAMVVQRLIDLNRQIESLHYLVEGHKNLVKMTVGGEAGLASNYKSNRKWERYLSGFKQEALDLTKCIMKLILLADEKYGNIDAWDMVVCAIDKKSLPVAIWGILCQNIDVWCAHSDKKRLKKFLSILINGSLRSVDDMRHGANTPDCPRVTIQQISSELLHDTILYEQKLVRRYMAEVFCGILEESILSLFKDSNGINFHVLPDWSEVASYLEKASLAISGNGNVTSQCSVRAQQSPDFSNEAHIFTSTGIEICRNLLNLLCWMPKDYFDFGSISRFTSVILNFERLLLCSLVHYHAEFSSQIYYELFRTFVSCRRALKCLCVAACEDRVGASQSSVVSVLFQGSSINLWLLKSASIVVELQWESQDDRVRHLKFSLMDHTSYMWLTLSKDQFRVVVYSFLSAKKPFEEPGLDHGQNDLSDGDQCLNLSKDNDIWKNITYIADTLKVHVEALLVSLKDGDHYKKSEFGVGALRVNHLSSLVACVQGFLWGLTSAIDDTDLTDHKHKLSKWKCESISRLNLCVNVFADFINFLLCTLLFKNDEWPESIRDTQKITEVNSTDSAATILRELDLSELQCLDKPLLKSMLNGNDPEKAFLLRQLFIASSAILSLNCKINHTLFQSSQVPTFISISRVMLFDLSNSVDVPPPLSIVCLDGVLKYLEEVGNQFSLINSTLTRNMYAKLIDLHLRAIGKCIALQGKRATLASHDRETSTKSLQTPLSHGPYCLDEFKSRLRMSLKVFISKPSDLHLLSAIQALERALVGAREDCTTVYEVCMGNAEGGKVSPVVAAGIDCLDLVLEFASGHKRLGMVKRHIQSFVSALFNIILHLQSPLIFNEKVSQNKGDAGPDSGSVTLMCIEVLTRISGKHALYQMDASHVAQSLRVPAALFQDFHLLKQSGTPSQHSSLTSKNSEDSPLSDKPSFVVDQRFSIDLFAACCRLLYTVLKHHKSECEQSIALLEVSVSVLLQCLETADDNPLIRKGYFSWNVQESVKCASFLRRIYEEIRHQKDVFGRYCFQFLSNYIWIYTGYGPLQTGIRREVDEALRPGVYALIDACSADDLQHLHTVFGEGPCRSTLAALEHDYKLKFLYEGKV